MSVLADEAYLTAKSVFFYTVLADEALSSAKNGIPTEKLRRKASIFKTATGTKKAVFITLLTTYGVETNTHSSGLVQSAVQLDDLFVVL